MKLLSISEFAEKCGVTPTTIRRWERAGKLKSVRTAGGHRRFIYDMDINLADEDSLLEPLFEATFEAEYQKFVSENEQWISEIAQRCIAKLRDSSLQSNGDLSDDCTPDSETMHELTGN